MDKDAFDATLKAMKMDKGWFNNVPRDLLYLALNRTVPETLAEEFLHKYGTLTHQSLEFFGDRILSTIAGTIVFQLEGLKISPHKATRFYSDLTSNLALLEISIREKFCQSLIESVECKYTRPTEKHNICSDSFEAVIGACYIFGLYWPKPDIIKELYKWFCSFESVKSFLEHHTGKTNVTSILQDRNPTVQWDYTIDITDSRLWQQCNAKKTSSLKATAKEFVPRTLNPANYKLPRILGDDPEEKLKYMEDLFKKKAKVIEMPDGGTSILLGNDQGMILLGSSKFGKNAAIMDLINTFS